MPKTTLTRSERTLRARLAAHESWANTEDRPARTAAARQALEDRWIEEARRRFGYTDPDKLTQAAEHLKKAHYVRLALKSARARRARKGGEAA